MSSYLPADFHSIGGLLGTLVFRECPRSEDRASRKLDLRRRSDGSSVHSINRAGAFEIKGQPSVFPIKPERWASSLPRALAIALWTLRVVRHARLLDCGCLCGWSCSSGSSLSRATTLTAGQRRASRRKRAKARRLWYLHSRGFGKSKGKGKLFMPGSKGPDLSNPLLSKALNPFQYSATPGPSQSSSTWGSAEVTPFQMAMGATTGPANAQAGTSSNNAEMVMQIKKAYAGKEDTIPPGIKEILDKYEQESGKSLIKSMHAATTALGRGKKNLAELTEAKKLLRSQWLVHLTESTKMWETQLQEYRQQLALLQEQSGKAAAEIDQARKTLHQLNARSKSLGDSTALQELPEEEETPAGTEDATDAEETKLRSSLLANLRAFSSSLGIEEDSKDAESISDGDEDEQDNDSRRKKRALEDAKHGVPDCCLSRHLGMFGNATVVDPFTARRDAEQLRLEVLRDQLVDSLPQIFQWRKDDEFHIDFDALLESDTEEDHRGLPIDMLEGGIPLHLRPHWVRDLHATLGEFGAIEQLEEGRVLYVNTWCLIGETRRHTSETRSWRINAHFHAWQDDLGLLWDDVLLPGVAWDAFVVRPRPPDAQGRISPAHILVVQRPQVGDAAALIPLHWISTALPDLDFQAAFLPQSCSSDDVFVIGRVYPNNLRRLCIAKHGSCEIQRNPMPPHVLSHGACVLVEIHPVGSHRAAGDEQSLMQVAHVDPAGHVPPPSLNPYDNLRLAVIYRLTFPPRRVYIRINSYEEMIAHSAALLHVDEMDVMALHEVEVDLPGEVTGAHSFIMQMVSDLPPGSPGKLGLFDIEYHEHGDGAYPPGVSRVVRATSHLLARQHVLQVTRVNHYCDRPGTHCIVKRNLRIWPKQDVKLYAVEHAWYYQVSVPPSPRAEECLLSTSEATRAAVPVPAQMLPSAQDDEGSSASDGREGYSPTPPSQRSRSPRSHRDDPQDEEEVEDDALLQASQVLMSPLKPSPVVDGLELPDCDRFGEDDAWQAPLFEHDPPADGRIFFQEQSNTSPNAFQWISGAWWSDVLRRPHEDPREARFLTYFLHGDRQRRCEFGRTVVLGDVGSEWFSRLTQAWRELIDPLFDLDYVLVRECPPGLREEGFAGAIILLQNPIDDQVALHISTRYEADRWQRAALFTSMTQNRYSLILLAQMGPLCFRHTLQLTCSVSIGSTLVTTATQRRVWDGLAVSITANVHAHLPTDALGDYVSSPALITTLHEAVAATDDSYDEQHWPVHTWYIHHRHAKRCDSSRLLLLAGNPDEWEDQVRALWADARMTSEAISASIIRPQPLHEGSQPLAVHVLLSQGFDDREPRAEILLSICDRRDWTFSALSTLPSLTWEQVIWYSAIMDCGPEVGDSNCVVWIGEDVMDQRTSLAPVPGTHLHVAVHEHAAPLDARVSGADDVEDQTSLLQHPPRPGSLTSHSEPSATWTPSQLDLHDVVVDFEWLDAHLSLPVFDFESLQAHLLPCALEWLRRPWFCYTTPTAGVHIHYDNLAVGRQACGDWAAKAHPWLGSLQRSLMRLCEFRYGATISLHHVYGHQGNPGNEAADALALAAAEGRPSADWSHYFAYVSKKTFVHHADWFWFLFHSLGQGEWHGHVLELPGKPRHCTPCQNDWIGPPQQDCACSTPISAHLDVHSHALLLQKRLSRAFVRQKSRPATPLKTSMSATTWELVQEKKMWRRHLADAQASQRLLFLQCCFEAWTHYEADDEEGDEGFVFCVDASMHAPDFAIHMVMKEDQFLQSSSWLHGVCMDLRWVEEVRPGSLPSGWEQDLTDFFDWIQNPTTPWKGLLRQVWFRHLKQEEIGLRTLQTHKQIFRELRLCGAEFDPSPFVDLDQLDLCFQCECGKSFSTGQGLATHRRKVHGHYSEEHHLLQGSCCPCCMRQFWCTQRLQQHLAYRSRRTGLNRCFQQLQAWGFHLPYEPCKMPETFAGLHRVEAVQMAGPMFQGPSVRQQEIARLREELELTRAELCPRYVPDDVEECRLLLFQDLSLTTQDWFAEFVAHDHVVDSENELPDLWLAVLMAGHDDLHDWAALQFLDWGDSDLGLVIDELADGEAEGLIDAAFYAVAETLTQYRRRQRCDAIDHRLRHLQMIMDEPFPHRGTFGAARLSSRRPLPVTEVPRAYKEQVLWHDRLRDLQWKTVPATQPVPLFVSLSQRPCFLVCHLFSGRRRAGDFHEALHAWGERRGYDVRILSMDTAVSEWYGDLLSTSPSRRQLTQLYSNGWVAATLCGPPCETYTEARHNPPPADLPRERARRWPRPLRSFLEIFGLEGLSMRELKQLDYGTMFVLNMLRIAGGHLGRGGLFVMEHPGPPSRPERASIWSLALTQLFRRHPDCGFHVLSQWRWGALACKPTGFLTVGVPQFWKTMWQHHLPDAQRPESVAIGVDNQGRFKTTVLKEYPPQLCKALAESIGFQLEANARTGRVKSWPAAQDGISAERAAEIVALNSLYAQSSSGSGNSETAGETARAARAWESSKGRKGPDDRGCLG
eukprot:Skav228415  [mRNA]  locus=scaffold1325:97576:109501:+ [translate_table: standard]